MENNQAPEYAGFWMRFIALIIDAVIIQMLQYIIISPILIRLGLSFLTPSNQNADMMESGEIATIMAGAFAQLIPIIMLAKVVTILYYTIMESSKYQATLGKMAIGLKVTGMDGNELGFLQSFLRQIGKILSSLTFCIGYIMAGVTEKKQALHDMMAGALVVRK